MDATIKSKLLWSIDEAVLYFSQKEESVSWAASGYPMSFEFDPANSDDSAESIMLSSAPQYFRLSSENSELIVSDVDGSFLVTARVFLTVDLKDGLSKEEFDEWSSEKGGWSCATISADDVDAYISEDSGGSLTLASQETPDLSAGGD
jgi:hypothetical protein